MSGKIQVNGAGRKLILASAVRNMHERGYHGTSMRDIAAGADVTVASIYHHFKSKQEVLQDIMTDTLHVVIGLTRGALLRAGGTPVDQLQAVVRAWVLFHTTQQPEAVVCATEIRSLDYEGRRLVVALRDEQESLFRDIVARGAEEGVFETPFPQDAARAIIHMGLSVCTWWQPGGDLSGTQLADRYAVLALEMLQPHLDDGR